ncbi:hypothetical protein LES60_16480 [Pectobacterium brasiliense]|uniref:hypothetical protein n=1 Tax=Pectobacterium brasiliense TaxID=180957 RepID=UPI001CE11249|nr:hypothetical protein [Pectobacterium brasiliense]MCA5921254.1 hypothetical protein [Pectobacterium brasiliense]MCA5928250.1 hypothetical protein [Pectobacterium brasiliense]MCA5937276.1 hypothetical protein [Pectobacterium brasiliense]MCA5941148.1 hypothetical protein [Pectobacterium brasiliense]MCA5945313.1 hypothetical protein [Pectobacterium brasiliense]
MGLKKIFSYAAKEFINTYTTMALMIGLGVLFYEFIPEHWVKLTILTIAIIIYVDMKFFSKKSDRK